MNTSWHIRFMCCIYHEHFLTHTFYVFTYTFYVLYMSWTLLDIYVLCVVCVMNTSRHIRFMCCICHEHFPTHTFYVLRTSWTLPDTYILCVNLFCVSIYPTLKICHKKPNYFFCISQITWNRTKFTYLQRKPSRAVLCFRLCLQHYWRARDDRKNHICVCSHYSVYLFSWHGMIKYHNIVYWYTQIENYAIAVLTKSSQCSQILPEVDKCLKKRLSQKMTPNPDMKKKKKPNCSREEEKATG